MLFITILAIIFTTFILFLNISHLHALLPVDYGKMVSKTLKSISFIFPFLNTGLISKLFDCQQTVAYLFLTVGYAVASSLVFHSHFTSFQLDSQIPTWTKNQILIASVRNRLRFQTYLFYKLWMIFPIDS